MESPAQRHLAKGNQQSAKARCNEIKAPYLILADDEDRAPPEKSCLAALGFDSCSGWRTIELLDDLAC